MAAAQRKIVGKSTGGKPPQITALGQDMKKDWVTPVYFWEPRICPGRPEALQSKVFTGS